MENYSNDYVLREERIEQDKKDEKSAANDASGFSSYQENFSEKALYIHAPNRALGNGAVK